MTYLADFCAWFQRQQASNRLELLVTLLQMLHPLELRFVGACVEELARKDYYCLREYEIRSNSGQVVSQLTDLSDAVCRSRLIVALSLLYSGNYATSAVLYRILLNLHTIFHQLPKTKDVVDEIILLLVMAKHHPAFRFDQRANVAELLEKVAASVALDECEASATAEEKRDDAENVGSVTTKSVVDSATQVDDEQAYCCTCGKSVAAPSGDSGVSELQQTPVYVTNIAVKGTRKTENEDIYDLQITWSDNQQTEASKTLRDMYDFHRQLLDWYPRDAGACGSGRKIPYFPGYRDGSAGEPASSENVSREVYEYIKDLVKLSPEILRSDYTMKFFKETAPSEPSSSAICGGNVPPDRLVITKRPCVLDPGSSEEGDCIDADGRVKSLTIYNSHVSPAERDAKQFASETNVAAPSRNESEPQMLSSPGPSTRMPKKLHKSSEAVLDSPKTSESSSTTSQTSVDLLQSVSTASTISASGGKANVKKMSSSTSSSSQTFIPNPLFYVLKQEELVEDYKHYLYPRTLQDLCGMSEADLMKAGLPLEPCLLIINAVKNYVLATTKQLNGTMIPKLGATDVVNSDMIFIRPTHRRSTPPVLELRSCSLGPDGTPLVTSIAPMPTMPPYVSIGALSVDTALPSSGSGKGGYQDAVNEPPAALSNAAPQSAETNTTTDPSFSTNYELRTQSIQRQLLLQQLNSEAAGSTTSTLCPLSSNNDPSQISASWVQPPSEDEFPSMVRSYSVDSSDHVTTATVVNLNSASTSLPPSQSQSPAPIEPQQTASFFQSTASAVTPTSGAPSSTRSSNNTGSNQHHGYQRNSKSSYRSPALNKPFKSGAPHSMTSSLHRRNYAPPFDYSRPQHLISFVPPHHQSMSGHPISLSTAIPAANFVRAPPPQSAPSGVPSQHVRLPPCHQCNGTSTTCPVCCHGNWNNGLLTPAAAAAGGPFLFQLTTPPTGPLAGTAQLFSPPYLTAQTAGSPVAAAQFFNAPPPNFRLPPATIAAASPMVFKSASATLVLGEQQHNQANLDNQLMRRSLTGEPITSVPPIASSTRMVESCCNCGLQGHTRDACVEPTLDDLTSSGHFHLNFAAKDESASTSQDR